MTFSQELGAALLILALVIGFGALAMGRPR